MDLRERIQLGEAMDITIRTQYYKTKLLDFVGSLGFIAYRPTLYGAPVTLKEEEEIRFSFFRIDGIYSFSAVFERFIVLDNLQVCQFYAISEIEKNQRRTAYRLPVLIDVWIRPGEPDGEEQEDIKAITVNISESGMLFSSMTPYQMGSRLRVLLKVERHYPLVINTEVVRCEAPTSRNDPYRIAVRYISISEHVRKHITQYIIRQQIMMRKRDNPNYE